MIGLVKAMGSHTAMAIHSFPVISWASRKTLRATNAPIKHMKTIVAGHHNWNHEPITQAGTNNSGRPGRWKSYASVLGRIEPWAGCGGSGNGACIPTKPGGWGASL